MDSQIHFNMVFRWGHSRSQASPFYLKIKTSGFHMKTSNVSNVSVHKRTVVPRYIAPRYIATKLSRTNFPPC